jgi:hypothetical protein
MRVRAAPLLATAVVLGLVCGAAISLAAFYVARYGPSAGNWSFRGNGAIAVYAAFPAVMAGGWTAIALHARGHEWLVRGIGAGVVGLLIALLGAGILPVLGAAADRLGSPIAFIALPAWMAAAPIAASRLRGGTRISALPHVVAGVLWLLSTAAGLVGVAVVLPAGS